MNRSSRGRCQSRPRSGRLAAAAEPRATAAGQSSGRSLGDHPLATTTYNAILSEPLTITDDAAVPFALYAAERLVTSKSPPTRGARLLVSSKRRSQPIYRPSRSIRCDRPRSC